MIKTNLFKGTCIQRTLRKTVDHFKSYDKRLKHLPTCQATQGLKLGTISN